MGRLTITINDKGWCNGKYTCKDDCGDCEHFGTMLYKLAHYEDLEEQGRLIELPCKVGDKVWLVVEKNDGMDIMMDLITGISVNQYADYHIVNRFPSGISTSMLDTTIPMEALGKIVFLTKEEADVKLKELKEGVE